MRTFSKLTIFFFCSICILSCKNDDYDFYDKYELKTTAKIVKFPLDETASINSFYKLQQFSENGVTFIYFLDNYKNKIYIYNTESKQLINNKAILKNGPNSVIESSQNHLVLNSSSLDDFIIYESASRSFKFFNRDTIYKKITLEKIYDDQISKKVVSWFEPPIPENIYFSNEKIFFSIKNQLPRLSKNEIKDYFNYGVLDVHNSEIQLFLKTPELYLNGNWGAKSAVHSTPFHCLNEEKKIIVIGFSGDKNIYTIEQFDKNTLIEHSGRSKLIGKIKPNLKNNKDRDENMKFSSVMPHYGPIYYDKFREKYYRIVSHGVSEEDYKEGKLRKDFSIIIFDKNFNIVGESLLKNGYEIYNPYKLYINQEGLFISRTDLYSENDNYFYFNKFDLLKK